MNFLRSISLIPFCALTLVAQTLYIPSGTSGIGSSTNGGVGIGTSSPSGVLDLGSGTAGRALSWGGTSGNYANIWTSYSSGALVLATGMRGSTSGDTFLSSYSGTITGRSAIRLSAFGETGAIRFFADQYTTVSEGTSVSPTERMRIDASGKVGIGTSSPAHRLSVSDPSPTAVYLRGNTGGQGPYVAAYYVAEGNIDYRGRGLLLPTSAAEAGSSWFAGVPYTGGGFQIGNSNVHNTETSGGPYDKAYAKLFITTEGNVGVGTTTPLHKLAVNGAIRAKEVIVDTGWSDYVFADDYRLAPLAEVEAHIKSEKHLPGIPSAKDVAEQGVSLGEMQAKLLAKIEELTLHQIALEKRLRQLEQGNNAPE